MTAGLLSGLRPYQRQVARAVLRSVFQRRAASFSVEIARQGGKNELSARLELALLLLHQDLPVTSIKAAPTFKPQAEISYKRLWQRVQDAGLEGQAVREGGNCVRLGRARQLFLSAEANSNVVGHTADLLLEIDEAQDVDIDKFDKEFGPMAAAHGATTVFYGTAWDDASLLERGRQAHLAQERRDGVRRHFEFDWQVVAAYNPDYGAYVRGERERLGAEHPLFLSQYCLRTLPGAGRLLGPTQLSLLRGAHAALDGPLPGETYVAGLDVGGEAMDGGGEAGHDASVLTIGRVQADAGLQAPVLEVVRHYAWTGAAHASLQASVTALLREWRIRCLVVDATGIGEPLASQLRGIVPGCRVEGLKLTAPSKSGLGYELLSAVNGARLRLYQGGAPELAQCWSQLERCRAVYRPNQSMSFYVDERDGHDDYVVSLALVLAAAAGSAPRRARGRAAAE
jgi:hypothetical protein